MTRQPGKAEKKEDCQWEFLCDRWLSRDKDDKEIVRELLPANNGLPAQGSLLH